MAAAGNNHITLTWAASSGAVTYEIKRSTSGGSYVRIATAVAATSYLDSGLTNGLLYCYVVSAVNAVGESPDAAEECATSMPSVPPRPENLKASPGDRRVSLTWLPSSEAASYKVKRSAASTGPYAVLANVTGAAFTDVTVVNGTKYFYVVSAVNTAGESKNSSKVSAVPAPIPTAPTRVSAATGSNPGEINLSWNASPWATQYKVKRSIASGGPYSTRKKVTTLTLTDSARRGGAITTW